MICQEEKQYISSIYTLGNFTVMQFLFQNLSSCHSPSLLMQDGCAMTCMWGNTFSLQVLNIADAFAQITVGRVPLLWNNCSADLEGRFVLGDFAAGLVKLKNESCKTAL